MINTVNYYVESKGIKLPDGTIFGAEKIKKFKTVSETGIPGFLVYEVIGKSIVNMFGSGVRVSWKEMEKALNEEITYQISIGNKVFRAGQEITRI